MKTTVDIPDQLLKEAMEHSKAHTKREVVVKALEDYNRRARLQKAISLLGTCENLMTNEELAQLRVQREKRHGFA